MAINKCYYITFEYLGAGYSEYLWHALLLYILDIYPYVVLEVENKNSMP